MTREYDPRAVGTDARHPFHWAGARSDVHPGWRASHDCLTKSPTAFSSSSSRAPFPGRLLASERALGEQFGVSRTIIREALRSRAGKGVVDMGRPSAEER